jgi:hypothetical protein
MLSQSAIRLGGYTKPFADFSEKSQLLYIKEESSSNKK